MCCLLHVKKGYSCNHETLDQREKVCLVFATTVLQVDYGQKNCALSDHAHKIDKNHTLKVCREQCIKM